jgi:hypothetical protein
MNSQYHTLKEDYSFSHPDSSHGSETVINFKVRHNVLFCIHYNLL